MKNRIKWLEDRPMEQQVGPTDQVEETLSTPTSSQGHQRVFLQLHAKSNNIRIPSLHLVPSQQTVWETWNKSRHEHLHQTITSVDDNSVHDPHAYEDIQNKHKGEREDQLHRDYNDPHDNENNAEIYTPEMSDDEDDLATMLDLPQQSLRGGTSWMTSMRQPAL